MPLRLRYEIQTLSRVLCLSRDFNVLSLRQDIGSLGNITSLEAGMRVGEIAALNVSDAYEPDRSAKAHIRLGRHRTKGRNARTLLLMLSRSENA